MINTYPSLFYFGQRTTLCPPTALLCTGGLSQLTMNRNVKATYAFYFTMSLANGIAGTVSSNFLYDLTGQNFYVGLAGAAQGLVQMLVAFPAGSWADKHRHSRARLLRYAAVMGYVAALVTMTGLLFLDRGSPHSAMQRRRRRRRPKTLLGTYSCCWRTCYGASKSATVTRYKRPCLPTPWPMGRSVPKTKVSAPFWTTLVVHLVRSRP